MNLVGSPPPPPACMQYHSSGAISLLTVHIVGSSDFFYFPAMLGVLQQAIFSCFLQVSFTRIISFSADSSYSILQKIPFPPLTQKQEHF